MIVKQNVKEQLQRLIEETTAIYKKFRKSKKEGKNEFTALYQSWYSGALPLIKKFAPYRFKEFLEYYFINFEKEQRERFNDEKTYTIQDYLIGIEPVRYTGYVGGEGWEPHAVVEAKLLNQFEILKSIESRIDTVLQNLEYEIYAEFQTIEIDTAKKIATNSPTAAGVLAAAILQNHLFRVLQIHEIDTTISNPTINDLVELLRNNGVLDFQQTRKIKHYADIYAMILKNTESQHSDITALLTGAEEVTKTVF